MADDAQSSEREFNEQNIEEFRRNGGEVGGQFEGFPLLLLTSTMPILMEIWHELTA